MDMVYNNVNTQDLSAFIPSPEVPPYCYSQKVRLETDMSDRDDSQGP